MDNCGERVRRARAHDTKATLVRVIATLVIGPLLLLDLGLSPPKTSPCAPGHCADALTNTPAIASLFWLVALVALLIALFLPERSAFRTPRLLILLASTTCGLVALLVLAVLPAA